MTQTIYGSLKGRTRAHHWRGERHRREHRAVRSTRRAARSRFSTTMRRPARRWPRSSASGCISSTTTCATSPPSRRRSGAPAMPRSHHDPRQQRCPRRPAHDRPGHAGILARALRHQSRPSVLRIAGGAAGHGEGGRRLDHQHGLDELHGERRFLRGLQDREIRGGRPHPGACARTRAEEHPRQLPRAGLDHDPAPDRSLAHAGKRGRTAQAPMREAQARAAGHRQFALFLGSDDSSAMSAQTYLVDGGWV